MRLRSYKIQAISLFVSLFVFAPPFIFSAPLPVKSRSFEFMYTTSIKDIPENTKTLSVWIPVPVSSEYQEISNLTVHAPSPYTITKDTAYNNTMINFSIKNPKSGTLALTLKFNVTRKEHFAAFKASPSSDIKTSAPKSSRASLAQYLKPSQKVIITSQIKEMARATTKGKKTQIEKIRALYDYVASFMRYDKTGTGWGNGDVEFCLLEKRGNCTDYHSLYAALSISLGIPTRFAIGFPIPRDKQEGEIGGYHCWAESYIEGEGLIPVDISEGDKSAERYEYFFGAHDENRVQFTVGRDLILSPKQKGKPINFLIYPYVEVDGKTYTNVEKKFYFKDTKPSL